MSDVPDYVDEQDDRFHLPGEWQDGPALAYTNTTGITLRPMSLGAMRIVARYFMEYDALRSYPYEGEDGGLFTDNEFIIEARSKMLDWLNATRLIDGTILYVNDQTARDVEIITLADAQNHPYPRAFSYGDESLDDNWLKLQIRSAPLFALMQQDILNLIQQNIGILNLDYIINPYPTTPPGPGGTWPPGTGPGPDPTTPPLPASESRINLNCADHIIQTWQGANTLDNTGLLGFITAIAHVPIPVLYLSNYDLKAAINAAILATGQVSNLDLVTEVGMCVVWGFGDRLSIQAFGLDESWLISLKPRINVQTTAHFDTPSKTYAIIPKPTKTLQTDGFQFKLPETAITVDAKMDISIRDETDIITLSNYQDIDTVLLGCDIMPAIFGGDNSPFSDIVNSPFLQFALKYIQLAYQTWRGAQLLGDIDNTCTVYDHAPGFLQTHFKLDWLNASGDKDMLFTGVNWKSNIDAILLEIYIPAAPGGIWIGNGDQSDATLDDWANANPQEPRDPTAGVIYFSEDKQVNRIAYTWLKVPNGQTNMGFFLTPNPFSGWVRIVAFHTTDGHITVQDAAHKCANLTYPPYPAYPFEVNPASLPGYVGHFEPNNLTGYTNGDNVPTISGLLPSNDLTPVSGGSGATINLNDTAANGRHTLSFNGSPGYVSASPMSLGGTNKLTVVAVISHADASSEIWASTSSDYGAHTDALELKTNGTQYVGAISGNVGESSWATNAVTTNQMVVLSVVMDKSQATNEVKIYKNGVQDGTASGNPNNTNGFGDYNFYLSGRGGTIVPWNGKLAHISIFKDGLPDTDRQNLENNLISKFGITV